MNDAGWNYSIFLQCYPVSVGPNNGSDDLIRNALGNGAEIEGIQRVSPKEVLIEIEESLCYAGDDGAGIDKKHLDTERFKVLLSNVMLEVHVITSASICIERFWLKAGHPAYPVFWDFAFLFQTRDKAMVLVGSSSD